MFVCMYMWNVYMNRNARQVSSGMVDQSPYFQSTSYLGTPAYKGVSNLCSGYCE